MSKIRHAPEHALVPAELIDRRIYLIRGQKVMLDADLAEVYQVLTKNLNLAVRRNLNRFPQDFMFPLTKDEAESLRLQIATSNVSTSLIARLKSDWFTGRIGLIRQLLELIENHFEVFIMS